MMAGTILMTGVLTYLSKPQYTATASVLANSPSGSTDRTLSFSEIATSSTLMQNVSGQLQLANSVDSLSQRVTVASDRTSNLYRITVTDSDPGRAMNLANAVASEAARLYMELAGAPGRSTAQGLADEQAAYLKRYIAASQALHDFQRDHPDAQTNRDPGIQSQLETLQLKEKAAGDAYLEFSSSVTKAQVDGITKPSSFDARVVDKASAKADTTSRKVKLLYGAAIGLVIGLVAIFLLEYLDTSVSQPEDAEQLVGAPIVGVIVHGDSRSLRAKKESG